MAANNKKNYRKNNREKINKAKKKMYERPGIYPKTLEEFNGHRGFIEYHMGKEDAKDILDLRTGKNKGIDPQKWLCDYVNEEYDLIGYCVKVVYT